MPLAFPDRFAGPDTGRDMLKPTFSAAEIRHGWVMYLTSQPNGMAALSLFQNELRLHAAMRTSKEVCGLTTLNLILQRIRSISFLPGRPFIILFSYHAHGDSILDIHPS